MDEIPIFTELTASEALGWMAQQVLEHPVTIEEMTARVGVLKRVGKAEAVVDELDIDGHTNPEVAASGSPRRRAATLSPESSGRQFDATKVAPLAWRRSPARTA